METKHYRIKANFAHEKDIATSCVAVVVKETEKALYLYGHGTKDPTGHCVKCGRTLTHPGSIILGIGPECLGDWGARDIVLENLSKEDIQAMEDVFTSKIIDTWIPKSRISETSPTDLVVTLPPDHQMKNKFGAPVGSATKTNYVPVQKQAKLVKLMSTGESAIKIEFPYDPELVSAIKQIPGRAFRNDGLNKYWTCPPSYDALEILEKYQFMFAKNLEELKNQLFKLQDEVKEAPISGLNKNYSHFKRLELVSWNPEQEEF